MNDCAVAGSAATQTSTAENKMVLMFLLDIRSPPPPGLADFP